MITAPLSRKAQITIPKRIREMLGVKAPGDRIGFLIDDKSRRIMVTRVELVPADESYTDQDIRKLLALRREPGGRTFRSAEAFLKHLRSL
jgi:AbrB family looped-hinge helix DNA binding protein